MQFLPSAVLVWLRMPPITCSLSSPRPVSVHIDVCPGLAREAYAVAAIT